MSRRLSAQIEEWVEQALDEQALGDRVSWDAQFALTEQGPQMLVAFFMPGAILGQLVQTVVLLSNVPQATQFDINETVKNVLEDLRKARSEQAQVEEPATPLFARQGG